MSFNSCAFVWIGAIVKQLNCFWFNDVIIAIFMS